MRLRQNFTKMEDYNAQAKILTGRFMEKGYSGEALEEVVFSVQNLERDPTFGRKAERKW